MAASLSGMAVPFTASAQVSKVPGLTLIGLVIVSADDAATITLYDSATGATDTVLVPEMTFAAQTGPSYLPLHIAPSKGLYAVVSGTVSAVAVVG